MKFEQMIEGLDQGDKEAKFNYNGDHYVINKESNAYVVAKDMANLGVIFEVIGRLVNKAEIRSFLADLIKGVTK